MKTKTVMIPTGDSYVGFDDAPIGNKVVWLIKNNNNIPNAVTPLLLNEYFDGTNDETVRARIEFFLREIFAPEWLIKCDENNNIQDIIDLNQLKIKFISISTEFSILIDTNGLVSVE